MESNNEKHIIKYSRESIQGNINMLNAFVNHFSKKLQKIFFCFYV